MRSSITKKMGWIAVLLAAGGLSACGNVSHKVAADGSGADQLMWPAADAVTPMHRGGSFPDVAELRLIQAGMNKQQIMPLIGAPHFSEGVWAVREWNYLFNFRKDGSNDVMQCQYKILFDKDKLARSFYWQPAACASVLAQDEVVKPEPVAAAQRTFTLMADALFAFDKSDAANILPGGMTQLEALAERIVAAGEEITAIRITGHTDRLGDDAYNQTLSERRAETVRHVLEGKGVAGGRMFAAGRGETEPVKQCGEQPRAALIACLTPNRRVDITVDGNL